MNLTRNDIIAVGETIGFRHVADGGDGSVRLSNTLEGEPGMDIVVIDEDGIRIRPQHYSPEELAQVRVRAEELAQALACNAQADLPAFELEEALPAIERAAAEYSLVPDGNHGFDDHHTAIGLRSARDHRRVLCLRFERNGLLVHYWEPEDHGRAHAFATELAKQITDYVYVE